MRKTLILAAVLVLTVSTLCSQGWGEDKNLPNNPDVPSSSANGVVAANG